MNVRLATLGDLNELVRLEREHMHEELTNHSQQMDGQSFADIELRELIQHHWIVVAVIDGNIVGYVLAGSWKFFDRWPIYRVMSKRLCNLEGRVAKDNSCQYGPIWVDPNHRGKGVFMMLVKEISRLAGQKYRHMLTFIAEENQHSFTVHTQAAKMQVADYFTFDERDYYLLIVST